MAIIAIFQPIRQYEKLARYQITAIIDSAIIGCSNSQKYFEKMVSIMHGLDFFMTV